MPPITLAAPADVDTGSVLALRRLVEAHRLQVLTSGIASDADRALWSACGLDGPLPAAHALADDTTGDHDGWFDAPQDWDSFWSRNG